MMFDTDVLIWASRGSFQAAAWINSDPHRAVSIVSVMEVLQGARSRNDMKSLQQSFRALQFRILPLTESIGHVALALIEEHALAAGLQIPDALIAATAIDAGEVLATSNVRHFRSIRSLEVKAFRPSQH